MLVVLRRREVEQAVDVMLCVLFWFEAYSSITSEPNSQFCQPEWRKKKRERTVVFLA